MAGPTSIGDPLAKFPLAPQKKKKKRWCKVQALAQSLPPYRKGRSKIFDEKKKNPSQKGHHGLTSIGDPWLKVPPLKKGLKSSQRCSPVLTSIGKDK